MQSVPRAEQEIRVKQKLLAEARKARNEADRMIAVLANSRHERSLRITKPANPKPDLDLPTNLILPAAFGSMGDDALRAGAIATAQTVSRPVQVWVPGSTAGWPGGPNGHTTVTSLDSLRATSLDPLRLGQPGFLSKQAKKLFGTRDTLVVGADTMGGDYLHGFLAYRIAALRESARHGMKAKLVNFSLGARPTQTAVDLLRSLPAEVELWARDELSRNRAVTLLHRDVSLSPDIGALAPATPTADSAALLRTLNGNSFVILTPNAQFETSGWFKRHELVDFWVQLALELSEEFEILILPHDVRLRPGDVELSNEIADRIHAASNRRVPVFVPASAGEAKALIRESRGMVTGRMHAGVGALSTGVPCVGLEYLNKFVGQFKWYGDLGRVIPLESSTDSAAIAAELRALIRTAQLRALTRTAQSSAEWHNPITPASIGWLK